MDLLNEPCLFFNEIGQFGLIKTHERLLGRFGHTLDVDSPAGQLGRKSGILTLTPDRQ